MTPEEQFTKIAEAAVANADKVKCSIPRYIEGLESIKSECDVAIDAAREDLERDGSQY